MSRDLPVVVIVGGGFGGLAAAKALRRAPARVILIDRTNHHVFQPLLYQVATGILTPGQIGSPIRGILRNQPNTSVFMGEVTGVNPAGKYVLANAVDRGDVHLSYDYLILATGATHNYFGRNEFEQYAPGLKSLADAVAIRNKVITAFEEAEVEENPSRHRDLLTFVLVGAGATGVEMAGALADLVRLTLRSEFRRIDPASARIVLVDAGPRVLGSFSEDLSTAAKNHLEQLGVEVRLGHTVDHVDAAGVVVAGERITSKTVIWTAGVSSSPAGKWLNAATDRSGRVCVEKDLSVPGHSEIFVVGDTASFDQDGKPLPGVAQVAIQQGRYAGRLIRRRITGESTPKPFRYFDKGNMAVVSRNCVILEIGRWHNTGLLAWFTWVAVHLQFLGEASLRASVLLQWIWSYVTGARGSVLIVNHRSSPALRAPTETRDLRLIEK